MKDDPLSISRTNPTQTPNGSSRSALNAPRVKIISMGDAGVGKSCVIKRFCEGRFVSKYIATIGIDYGVKRVPVPMVSPEGNAIVNKDAKVNFWDLAGGSEYYEVRNEFYKDAQGALLIFDVGQRASFDALQSWLHEAVKHGAVLGELSVVVCGNKAEGRARAVTEDEGKKWAAGHGFSYFDLSAKTGDGVEPAMHSLLGEVLRKIASPAVAATTTSAVKTGATKTADEIIAAVLDAQTVKRAPVAVPPSKPPVIAKSVSSSSMASTPSVGAATAPKPGPGVTTRARRRAGGSGSGVAGLFGSGRPSYSTTSSRTY